MLGSSALVNMDPRMSQGTSSGVLWLTALAAALL